MEAVTVGVLGLVPEFAFIDLQGGKYDDRRNY